MASLITVRLNKGDSPNWGFRLQGGKDFGTPLVIQKVNVGSPAERAGLIAGDAVIKINNTDVFDLRHKDAQDVVVRAGNNFEMTVQRGGSTWKPHVTPISSNLPAHTPVVNNVSPVTQTSLKHKRQDNIGAIGTGHNVSAKPFSAVNGAVNGGPKFVNKQYNTPLNLYSEQSIAETLAAQAEVLSTGALGVNFKKNEKDFDVSNSAVLRMLQEAEKEPRTPEADTDSGIDTRPNLGIAGLRHVSAPETKPKPASPQLPPGQNICAECERLIVGVFVRIKDKNLHVECFKCATCGTSLKNAGYYNINNKLYCDIHAKLAARNNPPAPNLVPVTVPPGGKAPAHAISSALAYHSSLPTPSPASPKLNSYGTSYQGNLTSPRPFSTVSAPVTSPKAPLSPVPPSLSSTTSYSPVSTTVRSSVQNTVWPPVQEETDLPTACPLYVPPPDCLHIEPKKHSIDSESNDIYSSLELEEINQMASFLEPKLSLCSEEITSITGRRSAFECIETITETLETQKLVEDIVKSRPKLPPPVDQDIKVTEMKAVEKKATEIDMTETQTSCQERSSVELKRPTEYSPNTLETPPKPVLSKIENPVPKKWESPMVKALTTVPDKQSGDTFSQIPVKHSSSALASALATAPTRPFTPQPAASAEPVPLPEETVPYFPPEHPIIIENKPPKPPKEDTQFVKALQTAPELPFTPVGAAPPKKKKDPIDDLLKDLPKPQERLTMLAALTTAPDRPYSPLVVESAGKIEKTCETNVDQKSAKKQSIDKSSLQKPTKPAELPESFRKLENQPEPKPPSYYFPVIQQNIEEEESELKQHKATKEVKTIETIEERQSAPSVTFMPVEDEEPKNFAPHFQGFTCTYKKQNQAFSVEISTTPPICYREKSQTPHSQISSVDEKVTKTEKITQESTTVEEESSHQKKRKQLTSVKGPIEKQAEEVVYKKPLSLTSTLHKPEGLPQYQVNLSETAEAELQLMEKVEAAQMRLEQKKMAEKVAKSQTMEQSTKEAIKKPIIVIQPGESRDIQSASFQPVDDRPQSTSFSPRPRPLTPSMINKPPPVIPYYQANLVAQPHAPIQTNFFDPTSPAVSRSPSPCPDRRERSPSPFVSPSAARPKSPAAGPPPNPLTSSQRLPTPQDWKREEAKRNLTTYIPEYRSKRELIEQSRQMQIQHQQRIQQHQIQQQKTQQLQLQQQKQQIQEQQKVQQQQIQRQQIQQQKTHDLQVQQQRQQQQIQQLQAQQEKAQKLQQQQNVQIQQQQLIQKQQHLLQQQKVQQVQQKQETQLQQQQPIMYTSQVQTHTIPASQYHMSERTDIYQSENATHVQKSSETGCLQSQEAQRAKLEVKQDAGRETRTMMTEQSRQQHSEQQRRSELQSVESSNDGRTQILRKKTVDEEYEHTQKCNIMQIEKSITTSGKHAFHEINTKAIEEQGVVGMHLTNPQPITSPFLQNEKKCTGGECRQDSSKLCPRTGQSCTQVKSQTCKESCQSSSKQQEQQCCRKSYDASVKSQASAQLTSNQQVGESVQSLLTVPNVPTPKPLRHVSAPVSSNKSDPSPNTGSGVGRQSGAIGVTPRRGRGILNAAVLGSARIPLCASCHSQIRGPFITALGRIWCPDHFICATPSCRRPLQDLGFVEERGQLYCEFCFEQYLAPTCSKCGAKVKGDCLKAIGKNFHPECFNCVYCGKLFGNSPFFLEDGNPYCEADWNELFTTKCFSCGFPIEAGDRWVEALNNNYHSQCFNCTMCKKNLEGQSFFAKAGRPYCKTHAR